MTERRSAAAWGIKLAKVWLSSGEPPFPVDVPRLALEYSRLTSPQRPIGQIKAVPELQDFEGGLFWLPGKQHWALLYRPNVDTPGRENFTLGHELGHFVLHRNLQDNFECSAENTIGHAADSRRVMEREADTFASYLLMPIDDYRAQVRGATVNIELLSACANRYGVSLTAAALKWVDFTEQCAVLVVARSGFIKWYRPSESAKPFAYNYFAPGSELPSLSGAAENYSSLSELDRRQGRAFGPRVWGPMSSGREMGIVSDKYDLTITLLIFDEPEERRRFDRDNASAEEDDSNEQAELEKNWSPRF